MKIDLEQEKFLKRLDLRINVLVEMLANHEKIIYESLIVDKSRLKKVYEDLDKYKKEVVKVIQDTDLKLVEYFDKLKEELKGE